jgi:hypothetical protein
VKTSEARTIRSLGADVPARSGMRWLQRFGVAGFAFFLIKGLLWLAVPALLAYLGYR